MEALVVLLIVLVGVLSSLFSLKKKEKRVNRSNIPNSVTDWQNSVRMASKTYGVPFPIAMAVLWVESAGNPDAVGSAGEKGLYQLKEIAVRDLRMQDIGEFPDYELDPNDNIKAGVAYLSLMRSRTDNWANAVRAYNQGVVGMKRYPDRADKYYEKVKERTKFFK